MEKQIKTLELSAEELAEIVDSACVSKSFIAIYRGADGSSDFESFVTKEEAELFCEEKLEVEMQAAISCGGEPPTSWDDLDEEWKVLSEPVFVVDPEEDFPFQFSCQEFDEKKVVVGDCAWLLVSSKQELLDLISAEMTHRCNVVAVDAARELEMEGAH